MLKTRVLVEMQADDAIPMDQQTPQYRFHFDQVTGDDDMDLLGFLNFLTQVVDEAKRKIASGMPQG